MNKEMPAQNKPAKLKGNFDNDQKKA